MRTIITKSLFICVVVSLAVFMSSCSYIGTGNDKKSTEYVIYDFDALADDINEVFDYDGKFGTRAYVSYVEHVFVIGTVLPIDESTYRLNYDREYSDLAESMKTVSRNWLKENVQDHGMHTAVYMKTQDDIIVLLYVDGINIQSAIETQANKVITQ